MTSFENSVSFLVLLDSLVLPVNMKHKVVVHQHLKMKANTSHFTDADSSLEVLDGSFSTCRPINEPKQRHLCRRGGPGGKNIQMKAGSSNGFQPSSTSTPYLNPYEDISDTDSEDGDQNEQAGPENLESNHQSDRDTTVEMEWVGETPLSHNREPSPVRDCEPSPVRDREPPPAPPVDSDSDSSISSEDEEVTDFVQKIHELVTQSGELVEAKQRKRNALLKKLDKNKVKQTRLIQKLNRCGNRVGKLERAIGKIERGIQIGHRMPGILE